MLSVALVIVCVIFCGLVIACDRAERGGNSAMIEKSAVENIYAPSSLPAVRKITFADLRDALAKGWADFMHTPTHAFVLAVIYPVIGLFLFRLTFGYNLLPLLFPLAAGFALVGPFAALGFYEISRQRERGMDPSWWSIQNFVSHRLRGAILELGALLMVIFFGWILTANAIFENIFGEEPVTSLSAFVHQVFETPEGLTLIIAGNLIGFLFALLCFCVSVVSFPLLVDRDVSAPAAIVTSLKAIATNPLTMLAWAAFIVAALIVGSLPALLGLTIVLPVLGHASWHLYRRVVV
jgi:uncharacterized membrane protein